LSELLYALDIKDVVKSSFGSLIGLPPFSEINYVAQIERDHPVVVEVLVNDFTHRAFSPIEDIGHKEEQNKQHRALMHSKITIANELNDLVYVANILSSFVAIVGEDDSFPYWPLYQVIHKQKHDSEEVEGLADQLLTLFDGKESFK
jgi:hypothetical protein